MTELSKGPPRMGLPSAEGGFVEPVAFARPGPREADPGRDPRSAMPDPSFQMVPSWHQPLFGHHTLGYNSHSQTRFPWEHGFKIE